MGNETCSSLGVGATCVSLVHRSGLVLLLHHSCFHSHIEVNIAIFTVHELSLLFLDSLIEGKLIFSAVGIRIGEKFLLDHVILIEHILHFVLRLLE